VTEAAESTPLVAARPVLVFDGDCAFCSSAVEFLRDRISSDVDYLPWQHLDLAAVGLTEEACLQAVQWLPVGGEHTSGGRAVTDLLRGAGQPWATLGRLGALPGVRALVELAYRAVAANRHRLPGGTPACQLPPRPKP
jgi:predicted DCC family thiol-disulfide oxidoreductase YuxK